MLEYHWIHAHSGNLVGLPGVVSMHIDPYIRGMPQPASSSATPDLFGYVSSPPGRLPREALTSVKAPVPELGSLTNARLVQLLRELTIELQRRQAEGTGRGNQPALDQAVREAVSALESLAPRQAGRTRRSKRAHAVPSLQEPKRKAIRAALQAGVAPGQVAKHFGLPLAAVRKVLTGAD